MSLEITARSRCIGFHRWPDAPDPRAYLRDRHRHEFHIAAVVAVEHSERAVEFHDLQQVIAAVIPHLADDMSSDAFEFGSRSCEVLAQGLAGQLEHRGYRVLSVTWSEDGQNDATWRPDPPDARDARTTAIPAQSAALPPLGAGR